MVLLESLPLEIGQKMPIFELKDPSNTNYSSAALMGKNGLLIKFTCNHCPYAIAVWDRFIRLADYASSLDINAVAINPNIHPGYPADSSENMLKLIAEKKLIFPYLVDESQNTARKYQAQCTPDIYLLKPDMSLYYHGRIDDNWQQEDMVSQEELKYALTLLSSDKNAPETQFPSMGCSIKWRQ